MKFHTFIASAALTVVTIASAHSPALSQDFKNPTHPRLFEVGTAQTQPQAVQPSANLSQGTTQTAQIKSTAGQTFFSAAPRLTRSSTSQQGANAPSIYEFTVSLPADAGRPLKAITIAQAENLEAIRFDVSSSKASTGNHYTAKSAIPLASVGGQPENSKAVTIVFDQPVQPGSTVSIALEAKSNPQFGGIYEFGVTAFPDGETGSGQFLGFGRLSFYGNE